MESRRSEWSRRRFEDVIVNLFVTKELNRFKMTLTIGIKKKDFDVVESIWKYCTGHLSIREIEERSGIPASRILEVLRALGNHVQWQKERVSNHVR